MLTEIRDVRQVPGEERRRWFCDDQLDLVVWLDAAGAVSGLQLCYDRGRDEHAVTWARGRGFGHHRVDDGEAGSEGRAKRTPVLVADGAFPRARVAERFRARSAALEPDLAQFVLDRLLECPDLE